LSICHEQEKLAFDEKSTFHEIPSDTLLLLEDFILLRSNLGRTTGAKMAFSTMNLGRRFIDCPFGIWLGS
jgi:hypothetical protein